MSQDAINVANNMVLAMLVHHAFSEQPDPGMAMRSFHDKLAALLPRQPKIVENPELHEPASEQLANIFVVAIAMQIRRTSH